MISRRRDRDVISSFDLFLSFKFKLCNKRVDMSMGLLRRDLRNNKWMKII